MHTHLDSRLSDPLDLRLPLITRGQAVTRVGNVALNRPPARRQRPQTARRPLAVAHGLEPASEL